MNSIASSIFSHPRVFELSQCDGVELNKQNARMDKAYKMAVSVLPAENKKKLQDSQALWVQYRKANRGLYYTLSGGTMYMGQAVN